MPSLWPGRHFFEPPLLNLLIVEQNKSQIVPMQDTLAARATSNAGSASSPGAAHVEILGANQAAQLGSLSSFPSSSYRDGAAGQIEHTDRGLSRPRRSRHPSQCVLRVKARGHRDPITVLGHAATISAASM